MSRGRGVDGGGGEGRGSQRKTLSHGNLGRKEDARASRLSSAKE